MNISDFSKCSNCGACYNICPGKAIEVKEDTLFYTPTVDEAKCIGCGLCVKVCPVNNDIEAFKPVEAFAGWHRDEAILMSSSSGGIFYGISQNVMAEGGVVYGAAYSDDNKEVIFKSSDELKLEKLQKSKYVESKVSYLYLNIKEELQKKRKVLFCGTPCQVAGLKQFLGSEYSNFITCDFVCGGLPSHKIYEEYLNCLEKKYKSKVKKIDFRPKTHGWKRYAVLAEFENGRKYNVLGVEDAFLRSFLYGKYTVRDYCLECKFSDMHKSDITIADFWLHKKLSDLTNDSGISLVICNTDKGKEEIEKIKDSYFLERMELDKALYNHKTTKTSYENKNKHDDFLQHSLDFGFFSAYKVFFNDSWKTKIENRIKRSILKGK